MRAFPSSVRPVLSSLLLTFAILLTPCSGQAALHPEERVDILGGTDSRFDLSHGNVLPLVARPWGMNAWAPVTDSDPTWPQWWFHPTDRNFRGIRCTHQPSPWIDDYGYFLVTASLTDPSHNDDMQFSGYNPSQSSWKPYYFNASLLAYATPTAVTTLELTATERAAVIKVTFPPVVTGLGNGFNQTRRVMINLANLTSDELAIETGPDGFLRVHGSTVANSGGVPYAGAVPLFRMWLTASVAGGVNGDIPIQTPSANIVKDKSSKSLYAYLDFDSADENARIITLRIATSFLSSAQADISLQREVGNATFEAVMAESKAVWQQQLNRVRVTDVGNYTAAQSESMLDVFYSCLYRASLFPRMLYEVDANGKDIHYSPYDKKGGTFDGVLVSDSGFWDAYRTVYPMLSIVYPETLGQMIQGWVNAYKEGGWLPKWASPGYLGSMVGTMGDNVLAEAIVKEIPGFDVDTAYAAIRQDAFETEKYIAFLRLQVPDSTDDREDWPPKGVGRIALAAYQKYGYIPGGRQVNGTTGPVTETVSRTLNYALSDYAIAQAAKKLGHDNDYTVLMNRSRAAYEHLFEPTLAMFRPKDTNGSWLEPFDQFAWGGDYTEAGPWQYRFYAPHDPKGLAALYDGAKAAHGTPSMCDAIETAQTMSSVFHLGGYSHEIHEMTEMALLCWGQYEHDNQPVHHMLYMGLAAADSVNASCVNRGRYWIRRVLTTLYQPGPAMFCGDEDNGQVASWYLLSALGLYALAPGDGLYTLGSPLFAAVDVDLPNNATLQLRAPGNGDGRTDVAAVFWNDTPISGVTLPHATLAKGGELRFVLA